MHDLEDLYSAVPPTKLRNIDEKFCPAATSPQWFWKPFGDKVFFDMLKKRFYAFRYKGADNFHSKDPNLPTIMFARIQTGGTES